mmetsp:Transcript_29671/g.71720  ORF Transcript_29671/g.71720 Transcript_29671/m.71720 type:complete len:169 (+) Transcript_29671:616-1122(+)
MERHGHSCRCTRSEMPAHKVRLPEKRKRRSRRSVRCGCKFKLNFSYVNRSNPQTSPIFITRVVYRHSHGCSGVLPVILTCKQERILERERSGARKLKESQPKISRGATEMIEHFRPMFKALAKHPQQKIFLHTLEGLKGVIEGREGPDSVAVSADMAGKIPLHDNSDD